jgi:hypothetical protein
MREQRLYLVWVWGTKIQDRIWLVSNDTVLVPLAFFLWFFSLFLLFGNQDIL